MHARRPNPAGPTALRVAARAFTLIELIVVIVIIAIAATAVVPRLIRDDSRRAEASAAAVREVLSSAATRAELTGRRVALTYSASSRELRVLEFRWAGSPTDWTAGGTWLPDELVPPATLVDSQIASIRADAFSADPRNWTVEFAPGSRRPSLSVVVAQDKSTRAWRIDLPSGSMRADLSSSDASGTGPAAPTSVVDLDAAGRQEEPW